MFGVLQTSARALAETANSRQGFLCSIKFSIDKIQQLEEIVNDLMCGQFDPT